MRYFAHSGNKVGHRHPAKEHLAGVGRLAEAFAGSAAWKEQAVLSRFSMTSASMPIFFRRGCAARKKAWITGRLADGGKALGGRLCPSLLQVLPESA